MSTKSIDTSSSAGGSMGGGFDPVADQLARQAIDDQRRENLKQLFTGARLELKPHFVFEIISSLVQGAKDVARDAKGLEAAQSSASKPSIADSAKLDPARVAAAGAKDAAAVGSAAVSVASTGVSTGAKAAARETAVAFIKTCVGAETMNEVMQLLGVNVIEQVVGAVSSAAPFFGSAMTGGNALFHLGKAFWNTYRLTRTHFHQKVLLTGDPEAAGKAIYRLIRREVTREFLDFGRLSAQFTVSITGDVLTVVGIGASPVSFGGTALLAGGTAMMAPAAALVSAVAKLAHTLFLVGRELREMRKGNKRLESPETLDRTIFEDCPIIGCYLLTSSNTSDLLGFETDMIGKPGWMDEVERMHSKHLVPLIEEASRAIRLSRYRLTNLPCSKSNYVYGDGLMESYHRTKLNTRQKIIEKARSLPGFISRKFKSSGK